MHAFRNNRAAAYMRVQCFEWAHQDAQFILRLDGENTTGMFDIQGLLGRSLMLLIYDEL
jgi:hypothetical protein